MPFTTEQQSKYDAWVAATTAFGVAIDTLEAAQDLMVTTAAAFKASMNPGTTPAPPGGTPPPPPTPGATSSPVGTWVRRDGDTILWESVRYVLDKGRVRRANGELTPDVEKTSNVNALGVVNLRGVVRFVQTTNAQTAYAYTGKPDWELVPIVQVTGGGKLV